MEPLGKYSVSKRVIIYEMLAFACIILFLWLDEVIDIPNLVLGAKATPLNWRESLFETVVVTIVGTIIVYYTNKIFRNMKYLEGLLSVCASCKRIRDEKGNWHQIESYIQERSEADFSHDICPDCAEKLYPGFSIHKKKQE
jgi:hypothetical protein